MLLFLIILHIALIALVASWYISFEREHRVINEILDSMREREELIEKLIKEIKENENL